jgi:hypothetical protein
MRKHPLNIEFSLSGFVVPGAESPWGHLRVRKNSDEIEVLIVPGAICP